MDARQEALAEAYRRGIMKPEQKAAYEEAMRRGLVQGPERSLGQRFLDNLGDAWERSGAGQLNRQANPNGNGTLGDVRDIWQAPRLREGGLIDRGLDAIAPDRGYLRGTTALTPAEQRERDRRASYDAAAETDPIENPLEFGAYIAGQVAGGAASPESWVAPGSSVVGRAAGNAAVNAGADVLLQGNDVMSGVQDRYSVGQTVGAAALGAGLSVTFDATRPLAGFVRRAFTDKVDPRVTPDTGATEGITVETPDGQMFDVPRAPETDGAGSTVAVPDAPKPPPPPEFDIVRPMERRGFLADVNRVVKDGDIPRVVADGLAKFYTASFDRLHPMVRTVEQMRSQIEELTGQPVNLKPSEDPLKLARVGYDAFNIGHQDVLHGVHGYRSATPQGPALADIITAVSTRELRRGGKPDAAVEQFGRYLAARRALGEWDRHAKGEIENAPVARSREETQAFLDRMDVDEPTFREMSDQANLYAQALLKKRLDAGLIDQATFDSATTSRDFYAPLRRVMDKQAAGPGVGGKNKSTEVKRFRGSDRDIVNPLEVLAQESYRLSQRIRQNDLNNAVVRMAENLDRVLKRIDPDAENPFLRKVDRPMQKTTVGNDELARSAGVTRDKIDELFDDDLEVFRPGEINEGGRPVLYVWRNGKREAFELVDEDWGRMTYEAISSLTQAQEDVFQNLLGATTQFVSRTITRDPAFIFTNFIRDQIGTWIISDVGFKPGEGILGVADELRGADSGRVYALGGGLAGGESTAGLTSALQQRDVVELARKGIKTRYFSDLKGFLRGTQDVMRFTEITEVGTRRQVFKRAFDRARASGLDEYDAIVEAGFAARDIIDFGRHGSKMHATRRLVTFLNAWQQGLDKMIRTAVTDPASAIGRAHQMGGNEAALKAILRPLFRNQQGLDALPIRDSDKAALKLAVHAWTRMSMLGALGVALSAVWHDDPDYQAANEKVRATHWVIPFGGTFARIPKPFELAFMSNITERATEAALGNDPTAWEKLWKGTVELFAPPTSVPVLDVATGLTTGVNPRTGRDIVPESLEALPPELQYQTWTSQFARDFGKLLGVSPAKIDFVVQSFGGPYGSYALAASDASDPERPSGSWVDLPVVSRFISPSFRGNQDKRDFYDRAGARNSELRRTLNGIKEYEERGQTGAAQQIFSELDEPGRLFVMSQRGEAATDRLNPLVRAEASGREISRMIGELNGARPKDGAGPLPAMSAQKRQAVSDALERVAVAEMRNAMIATRQPGFAGRRQLDRAALWSELEATEPRVADELAYRMRSGRDQAYDYDAVMELWPEVEARLRGEGSAAYLDDLAGEAAGRSGVSGEGAEPPERQALNLMLQ